MTSKDIELQYDESSNKSTQTKTKKSKKQSGTIVGLEHTDSKSSNKREIKFHEIVIHSPLLHYSPDEQSEKILELYNANVEKTCFLKHPPAGFAMVRRVPPNSFLLGHRNQVAELADPRGSRIGMIINLNPLVRVESLGTVIKTSEFYGEFGKFVLNVPAGHLAKAYSKNTPVLYGEGPHVIVDPTFRFTPAGGFVSQISPYIQHATIHILRVPAGKLAKVWLGTIPKILESREAPYIFNDSQFVHVPNNTFNDPFYDATERYILHGSIKRLIPHTGEVAVTYNNGILEVVTPPKNITSPIIIDSATHNFDSFLKTSLQTYLIPSEETKQQSLKDNPKASADERNLKIFQTRDSLRVGVILVVAYKIIKPELAVSILGSDGIQTHIENVAFADMGKAIQFSTLQEVMFATSSKSTSLTNMSSMQDRVRENLAKDLSEYGIELARLDIETLKVLDEKIAQKLAGQSVIGAEYTTKQATLVKEYDIKTTEAKLKAETDNIQVQQQTRAKLAEAQADLDAAKKLGEASVVTANADQKSLALKGKLYKKYPMLYDLEMASIRAKALSKATIIVAPDQLGNLVSAGNIFRNVFADNNNSSNNNSSNNNSGNSGGNSSNVNNSDGNDIDNSNQRINNKYNYNDSDSESDDDDDDDFILQKEKLMKKLSILAEQEEAKKSAKLAAKLAKKKQREEEGILDKGGILEKGILERGILEKGKEENDE